jgi:hypothetical protein
MYKTGEAAIDRVLQLVAKCPKELQEKCFEILLSGYVQFEVDQAKPRLSPDPQKTQQTQQQQGPPAESSIPSAALSRFRNMAGRLGVTVDRLEKLFDFSVDPFALQAIRLPGKTSAEKTREVALLAASRSYLAAGTWSADWQELKSLCVDHNCYNVANHTVYLRRGVEEALFKGVESGKAIELSAGGVRKAEQLLKGLAEGTKNDSSE